MKVLIEDTIVYVSYWKRDCHFTCSSEPRGGQAVYRAKALSSFVSFCKTKSIAPAPRIDPETSRFEVKRSNDWANPVVDIVPLVGRIGNVINATQG